MSELMGFFFLIFLIFVFTCVGILAFYKTLSLILKHEKWNGWGIFSGLLIAADIVTVTYILIMLR